MPVLTKEQKDKAKKKKQPAWIEPSLAKLTDDYFSHPEWIYERKLDGVRCVIVKNNDKVQLLSRSKHNRNGSYPELVVPLENQLYSFIADGEIVTFDNNITSFSKLQGRINVEKPTEGLIKKIPVYLYLFDLMYIEGHDITSIDLRTRKNILKKALQFDDGIRFCTHIDQDGESYLQEACKKGWEGLIAKNATKGYIHGRSTKWLKFKCVNRQELVIGGYTPPQGERVGFGALLVGYYDGKDLKYAGKVGTGYSDKELKELHNKMKELQQNKSPFTDFDGKSDASWIEPKLVAEIGFTEWTSSGKLRHPRYVGLRNDKTPNEVTREA